MNTRKINYILAIIIFILLIVLFYPKPRDYFFVYKDIDTNGNTVQILNKSYQIKSTIVEDEKISGDGYDIFNSKNDILIKLENTGNEDIKVTIGNKFSDTAFLLPKNEIRCILVGGENRNKKSLDFISESGVGEGRYTVYELEDN